MSESTIADQSYLFLNRIQDRRFILRLKISVSLSRWLENPLNFRRFDEESLRILELSLVATSAKSFSDLRSGLRDLMRSESSVVFGELTGESVVAKLSVLEFFARAFALIGDTEVCVYVIFELSGFDRLLS